MDKVLLTVKDVDMLLAWRDQHIEEVYAAPMPLKAVEVCIKETDVRFKAVRAGNEVTFRLSKNYTPLGNCTLKKAPDGRWIETKNRMRAGIEQKDVESMLSVYCSLMALMVYGKAELEPAEIREPKQATHRAAKKAKGRKTSGITYILKSSNGRILAAPQGSHTSPAGTFTVHGHFRHYKSGKVVWISEYTKGDKPRKNRKTYKMGGKHERNGE